jgi:hypothetical protein
MLARLLIFAVPLALAACGAALPGYSPTPLKGKTKIEARESGDVDASGTYQMTDQEKAIDCKRLAGSMMITISRLRVRQNEVATSNLATTTNKVVAPIFGGSGKGLDRDAEYVRDRARLTAYNQHLAAKNCATIDIEAELAKAPETAQRQH